MAHTHQKVHSTQTSIRVEANAHLCKTYITCTCPPHSKQQNLIEPSTKYETYDSPSREEILFGLAFSLDHHTFASTWFKPATSF